MKIYNPWSEFKTLFLAKNGMLQYTESDNKYIIWFNDGTDYYKTEIYKTSDIDDKNDFDQNYKSTSNQPETPKSDDGKTIVRSESRPLDCTTVFIGRADSTTNIGDGTKLLWNFSNDDNIVNYSSGDSTKTKRIEFKFLDSVYIKEGALYFQNAPYGSYASLKVVCPQDSYYLKNDGTPTQAQEDTVVEHFVINQFLLGDCTIGDELNTEACSTEIPNYYKFWLEVTVPSSCDNCIGHVSLELYRTRTVVLE